MARSTMTALIALVARLVDDQAHDLWSEDAIQAALDANRMEARYLKLTAIPTKAPTGTTFLTFDAPATHWEEGAAFYTGDYNALAPPTSEDYIAGRWTWSTAPDPRPVYLLGYTYDIYAAAADLLEERAAGTAEDLSTFTVPHGTVAYAGKTGNWLALAATYRARQRAQMGTIRRTDLES